MTEEEQMKARKGTILIPFSQLPPKKLRKDCFYHYTPAMEAPSSLRNLDSCEVKISTCLPNFITYIHIYIYLICVQNWLPRRALSGSRIAGILHALEGWNEHECGDSMLNPDKVWQTSLHYGFRPLDLTLPPNFL